MDLKFFAASDIGLKRKDNQDSYLINPDYHFFVIADGMGGEAGGAYASKLAVEAIDSYLSLFFKSASSAGSMEILSALNRALNAANKTVFNTSREQPAFKGMGSTLSLLLLRENYYFAAHVGDSRIYLLRNGNFELVTTDHSFSYMLYEQGIISKEQASKHPQKNILINSLGTKENLRIQFKQGLANDGDVYLICSDGLTGLVTDEKIKEILLSGLSLKEKAASLISNAKNNGGTDNITACIIQVISSAKTSNLNQIPDNILEKEGNYSKLIDISTKNIEMSEKPTEELPILDLAEDIKILSFLEEKKKNHYSAINTISSGSVPENSGKAADGFNETESVCSGKRNKFLIVVFMLLIITSIIMAFSDFVLPFLNQK